MDEYLTAEDAAYLTGRSTDIIYRWIRNGTIETVADPTDGRRKLIQLDSLTDAHINQRQRGRSIKKVQLSLPDGRTITRLIATSD
jgi:excisionase family DNA binding protein